MARTGQFNAGEGLAAFAARMGVSVEDLYRLNPKLGPESFVEGFSLVLPEVETFPAVPKSTPYTGPTPIEAATPNPATGAPAESAAPTGDLTGDTSGLFNEMLKNFTTAFQTFLSAPAFVRNQDTARAGVQAGHPGAIGGFSQQEASFLREIEPELYSQYGEAVQKQFALTGKIPTLTAADFLKGINVKEKMEMEAPGTTRGNRRFGPPSIAPRRLRF